MGIMDIFRRKPSEDIAVVDAPMTITQPISNIAIGASESSPSMTFSDKNITFTGDLSGFDYEAILRDKQKYANIQKLFQ